MNFKRNKLGQNTTKDTISTDSATRLIEIKGNKIIYTLKLDGIKDYLSYNKTLLDILKLDKLKPFRDCGRLRFKVRENKTDINIYLYDLAYACYSGQVNSEIFLKDIQKYYEHKAFNNLSIDHADNNVMNNTEYNLSSMDKNLNVRKGNIVSRVKEPIYLNSAYYEGKYRVQMLFITKSSTNSTIISRSLDKSVDCTNGYCALHFLCDTPESYVDCLRWLTTQHYEWAKPLRKDGNWIKNDNNCWCSKINNSLQAQMILSKLPTQIFQKFIQNN